MNISRKNEYFKKKRMFFHIVGNASNMKKIEILFPK